MKKLICTLTSVLLVMGSTFSPLWHITTVWNLYRCLQSRQQNIY